MASLPLLLLPHAGHAQQSRYSSEWRQPAQQPQSDAVPGRSADLDRLLKELGKLTSDAEKARAADPRFLNDLKDLVRRYSWPWNRLVFADDFRDGDLSRDPKWTIISGSFPVQQGGLVTRVTAAPAPTEPKSETAPKQQGSDDFARQLLGGVLREMTRGRESQGTETERRSEPAEKARIEVAAQIPNQFAVRVELQSRTTGQGRLEFGVGQGADALGYYLVYNAGSPASISLLRKGTRGAAVIESTADPVSLGDGGTHILLFTRDASGDMNVSLDGKSRFRVLDRAFRSGFDRFVILNGGGDFTIRSVAVHGAP